jgi:hypothetical protein
MTVGGVHSTRNTLMPSRIGFYRSRCICGLENAILVQFQVPYTHFNKGSF